MIKIAENMQKAEIEKLLTTMKYGEEVTAEGSSIFVGKRLVFGGPEYIIYNSESIAISCQTNPSHAATTLAFATSTRGRYLSSMERTEYLDGRIR